MRAPSSSPMRAPPSRRRHGGAVAAALVAAAALFAALPLLPTAGAFTQPDQYAALVAFRDAMLLRRATRNWANALASWRCPTPPANSDAPCDPCGRRSDGNWAHAHCRGNSRGWGESGDLAPIGNVTNMHITDVDIDGPVPRELCLLRWLREFDVDGGHLTGPVPTWISVCNPHVEELDLSYNRLTGTLPAELAALPRLSEVKVEYNSLHGTIPEAFGAVRRMRRFQVDHNRMGGRIPESFRNFASSITQFQIAHNDFEGDLSALSPSRLMIALVNDNPKLCGMVPASVRYAKGYNPANTRLGQPC